MDLKLFSEVKISTFSCHYWISYILLNVPEKNAHPTSLCHLHFTFVVLQYRRNRIKVCVFLLKVFNKTFTFTKTELDHIPFQ